MPDDTDSQPSPRRTKKKKAKSPANRRKGPSLKSVERTAILLPGGHFMTLKMNKANKRLYANTPTARILITIIPE